MGIFDIPYEKNTNVFWKILKFASDQLWTLNMLKQYIWTRNIFPFLKTRQHSTNLTFLTWISLYNIFASRICYFCENPCNHFVCLSYYCPTTNIPWHIKPLTKHAGIHLTMEIEPHTLLSSRIHPWWSEESDVRSMSVMGKFPSVLLTLIEIIFYFW